MRTKKRERSENICQDTCKIRAALDTPEKVIDAKDRFWGKVNVGRIDECWEWQGSFTGNGYGSFRLPSPSRDVTGAHRISYFFAKGEIPSGHLIRHKCDNPKCVNPHHLETGTKSDNARDMVSRGRAPVRDQRGEKNGAAKLAASDVAVIKGMIAKGKRNIEIALKFDVSHGTISNIRRGKAWASL